MFLDIVSNFYRCVADLICKKKNHILFQVVATMNITFADHLVSFFGGTSSHGALVPLFLRFGTWTLLR